MRYISPFGKKLANFSRKTSLKASIAHLCHSMIFHVTPFWLHLCYYLLLSLMGFLALKVPLPRTNHKLDDTNLFFTSVSATTLSSMSTIEMEVFSSHQLIIITILMFLGGEVLTSIIFFQFERFKSSLSQNRNFNSFSTIDLVYNTNQTPQDQQVVVVELGMINNSQTTTNGLFTNDNDDQNLMDNSIKYLVYVILGYILVINIVGSTLISLYISSNPSANNVLKNKGIILHIFSIFTSISTFANCGFIPTNENMIAFRAYPGLLLILLPQILLGNTLYMPCLRLVIHVLERVTNKKEYSYLLTYYHKLGYDHLKSSKESWYVAGTNLVLLFVQFAMFALMEWNSETMEGMSSSYQTIIGTLFLASNSRHSGETVVDLSKVSAAILVLISIMMYLPPYTSFVPLGSDKKEELKNNDKKKSKNHIVENMLLSPLAYVAVFVIVICITERKALKKDPLNFNLINILVEVTSAYGNVGFSTGYSCKRRLKIDDTCVDKWYGFVGKWSNKGKFALILVMFIGRFKKFIMHGGKAWKLV